jgi:alpha-glucosidase
MKRDSLIYQILPASFNQDIAGITRKLDYLADLGVTTIWLNPFYPSGGKDNGYDPTDMRAVASNFGTMQDFDRLIEEAGKSNIGVIVDLIAGHVSDQHVWFQEARSNRDNPKRDYFVWRDVRQRNNWLSMFGGSEPMPAWTYDEKTRQDYLHHFFPQQPTLNLRHPEVVEDILNTVKFWKSRGVAGFRVDAVDHLFHDIQFRDNPRITDDLSVKPFKRQLHLHDIMQIDETLGFLARIRAAADSSLLLIAEVSSQQAPLSTAQRISLYTSEGGFDSAYTLGLIREPELNPSMFSKMYKET